MLLKSQNGWPASSNPSVVNVRTFEVPLSAGTLKIPMRAEVAPRFIEMLKWWDRNIEPVMVKPLEGTWGYAYRTIRGYTTTLSNHASGTAIDINAPKHELGDEGTIAPEKVGPLRAKAAELGLRWGGDYRGRKDEMHFEVITAPPPEAVAYSEKRAAGLSATAPEAAEYAVAVAKGAARKVVGGGRKELKRKLRRNWWIAGIGFVGILVAGWLAFGKPKKALPAPPTVANPRRRRRR
jgi:hypothetical protein